MTAQQSEGQLNFPKIRDDLIFRQLDEEWVVYDSNGEKLHVLNRSAAVVWLYCTGEYTVEEITEAVTDVYDLQHQRALIESDVQRTLAEFAAMELFE